VLAAFSAGRRRVPGAADNGDVAIFTLRTYCHLVPGSPDKMRQAIDLAFSESPDCPGIAQEGENGR
jgi:hypothetical protein